MRLQIRRAKGRTRAFRPFDQDESRLPTDDELRLIRDVIDPTAEREREVPDP